MSDNVTQLYEAALAKDRQGEGGDAVALLDTLLEYQPGHRLALFYRGMLKIRYRKDAEGALKDWEDAFVGAYQGAHQRVAQMYPGLLDSCMERLIQLTTEDPHCAGFHSALGRAGLLFENEDRADRHLRRALDLDPQRNIDAIRLGELRQKQGKMEDALSLLQTQAQRDPESGELQWALGSLHRACNRTALAIKHLEAAFALNPYLCGARQALAEIYLTQGRVEQAEGHYQHLLEHAPSAAVLIGLAECDKSHYRFDEALERTKKAAQMEPGNFKIQAELGALALQLGQADLGMTALKRALEIDPNHAEVYGQLAKAHIQKGETREAIRLLRLQLVHDPQDGYACYALASQLRLIGNFAEAAALLPTTLQSRPGDVQVCLELAECYEKLNRLRDAVRVLREAFDRNPMREDLKAALLRLDPEALEIPDAPQRPAVEEHVNLGRAHLSAGRTTEAFEAFRKALTEEPEHRESLIQVARIYRSRKMNEPACEFFLRAFAQDKGEFSVLVDLFEALYSMPEPAVKELLAHLATVLPQDLEAYPWLEYLWGERKQAGLDRWLLALLGAVQKEFPPGHRVARQWLDLQTTARQS